MGVAVAPIEYLQGKGTEAVSTCACEVMGRACARGSAHLRTKHSSSRRHLRAAAVQSGRNGARPAQGRHRRADHGFSIRMHVRWPRQAESLT